jgi:hypothetical protein
MFGGEKEVAKADRLRLREANALSRACFKLLSAM